MDFLIETADLQAKFLAIFQLLSISSQGMDWEQEETGLSRGGAVAELRAKLVRFSLAR